MINLQCKLDIPQVPDLPDNQLTVGREFLFVCEGEFPRDLNQEKLELVKTPEMKYQIQLLGFEFRSPTQADVKVTSYVVGQQKFEQLQLTDGTYSLNLGDQAFGVITVITPEEIQKQKELFGEAGATENPATFSGEPVQNPAAPQGQGQGAQIKPYPAMGPVEISLPTVYWASGLALLGLILVLISFKVFRKIQRANLLERLKQYDSAQTPAQEFHSSFRRFQRTNQVFYGQEVSSEEVQSAVQTAAKAFRIYLTRQFQVPALEWSAKLILQNLRKYHVAVYQEHHAAISKLLVEYALAEQDLSKLTKVDALNLANNTRKLVEQLEKKI